MLPLRCRHIHLLVSRIPRLHRLQPRDLQPRHRCHHLHPLHPWKVRQWTGLWCRLCTLRRWGLHQLLRQERLHAVCCREVRWQWSHDVPPVPRGEVFQHRRIRRLHLVHQRHHLHHKHRLNCLHSLHQDMCHRQSDPGPVHPLLRHLLRRMHSDFQLLLHPRRVVRQHHQPKLPLSPRIRAHWGPVSAVQAGVLQKHQFLPPLHPVDFPSLRSGLLPFQRHPFPRQFLCAVSNPFSWECRGQKHERVLLGLQSRL